MNLVQGIVILMVLLISHSAWADEKITVYVEYRHGAVHVHYPIPCSYNVTCTLTSLDGAEFPWRVEVIANKLQHGLVSVETVVREGALEVSRFRFQNKMGEESKIATNGPDGGPVHLSVRSSEYMNADKTP